MLRGLRTCCAGIAVLVAGCSDGDDPRAARVDGLAHAEAAPRGELARKLSLIDPKEDGWDTEVFHELVEERLASLAALEAKLAELSTPTPFAEVRRAKTESAIRALAAPAFATAPLVPSALETAWTSAAYRIRRGSTEGEDAAFHGPDGLLAAIAQLIEPFAGIGGLEVEFKTFLVEPEGETVLTTSLYDTTGPSPVQQTATWRCRWTRAAADEGPRLLGVEVIDFEETQRLVPAFFEDCTKAVLGGQPAFDQEVMPSLNHWRGTLDKTLGLSIFGHQGIALGDADGDGLEDVYVCQTGGLPNLLFVQGTDGRATERARAAGVDILDESHGALFCDLDGDGDQDLVVAADGVVFLANDGRGRFEIRAHAEVLGPMSLAAADFDGDADVDVYVCCYQPPDVLVPQPYYDSNNGPPNVLFRNDGDFRFVDATSATGLASNNRRFTFSAVWEDYDDDGDQDLYVVNDFGRNNLYQNEGGRFRDVAAEAGVEDQSAGMGATWGDYDGDGAMDLYVSNRFSSAGYRVAYQRGFRADVDEATREALRRHARGNSLFRNRGDGTFEDVTAENGVGMGRWAWSSKFFDADNDGFEDLLIANGFLTNEDPHDL